jgi:hypothetical protein
MLPVYGGKSLSSKEVHNWVGKFSQGCSKAAHDAQPSRHFESATEAAVQQMEELT